MDVEKNFREKDRKDILRANNIKKIPGPRHRIGGKKSYAEWAHVVGIFQTLIYRYHKFLMPLQIVDAGCGTGILAIAAQPFVKEGGKYIGLDVRGEDIAFCRSHYGPEFGNFEFHEIQDHNGHYSPGKKASASGWPVSAGSCQIVTGLSLFTHLDKESAIKNMKEAEKALKRGGVAIITLFYLDEIYHDFATSRGNGKSRYNSTNQNQWIFTEPVKGCEDWRSPKWANPPEKAIGVTRIGLENMARESGLIIRDIFPGNWKGIPGLYFQDIVVLEKATPERVKFFKDKVYQ